MRDYEYKRFLLKVDGTVNAHIVRIYEDVTRPPVAQFESGPRALGLNELLKLARNRVDDIEKEKPPGHRSKKF